MCFSADLHLTPSPNDRVGRPNTVKEEHKTSYFHLFCNGGKGGQDDAKVWSLGFQMPWHLLGTTSL